MPRSTRISLSSKLGDDHGTDTHAATPALAERDLLLAERDPLAVDEHRRFGDGTLWSFAGVEVVELLQEPTPPIPIFRHTSPRHGGRVAVMFLIEGEVQVTHGGEHFHFLAGSAAYIATGTVTLVEATETCRVVIVSVTRDWLLAWGVAIEASFGAFAASSTRTSPLLTFLLALIEVVSERSIPTEPTATVLTDLMVGLFRADGAYSASSIGTGLDLEFDGYRETVKEFLLAQVEDLDSS